MGIEVTATGGYVLIRNVPGPGNPYGGMTLTGSEWQAFLAGARNGESDSTADFSGTVFLKRMWQAKTETAGDFMFCHSETIAPAFLPRMAGNQAGSRCRCATSVYTIGPILALRTPTRLAGKRTGERIQILRERKGLTRPVLAGLVGCLRAG